MRGLGLLGVSRLLIYRRVCDDVHLESLIRRSGLRCGIRSFTSLKMPSPLYDGISGSCLR